MNFLKKLSIVSLLFIIGCSHFGEIKVVNKNFSDEIELQQNLVFTFNNNLFPDSALHSWDTTEYIKFIPAVKGKFKWSGQNELIFSPSQQFKPSTNYKAELTKLILKHADKKYSLSDENTFQFHTVYLKLTGADIFWTRSEKTSGKVDMKINLNHNYKVDPTEEAKLLHVFIDGKTVNFEMNTSMVNDVITITVNDVDKEKSTGQPLKIIIDKGLRCVESDYATAEIFELETPIPSPDKLEIKQALAEYENNQGFIHIYTTQAVEEENIKLFLTLKPTIPFTVEFDDFGFYLRGNFEAGSTYELTVSSKLKGVLGAELGKDFYQVISFGQIEPSINFTASKAIYLSSKSSKNIGVNIVNVPKVKVTIIKIYENNILAYMHSNRYSNYYEEDEDGYGFSYNSYNWENYGDVVFSRDYETKNLPKINGSIRLLNINMEEQNAFKGIYLVKVASIENQWLNASKIISVSDVGLIVKQTENDVMVFANSIKDATALSGVKINFISSNNQTVSTGITNSDGVVVFNDIKRKTPNFKVAMITAKDDKDFNYLIFNDVRVENSRFDVGGKTTNDAGYQAFIYGDRDIYRPGETVYINTIVRDEQWNKAGQIPIKMKVLLPNGKEYKSIKGMLDKQGAYETSVKLASSVVTGTYTIEVYSANDVFLNSQRISVEEFMPDRIKVDLTLDKTEIYPNDSLLAKLNAVNLFGPPAANRKYEMELSLNRKSFHPKQFSDYNFEMYGKDKVTLNKDLKEGKTDEKGNAKETFIIAKEYQNMGILSGKIFATVFDESGRPVNRVKKFDVYTQQIFYGIKYPESYISANSPVTIPLIAVDKNGRPVKNTSAKIQVVKYNWQTVIEREGEGRYHYVSQKQEKLIQDKIVTINEGGYNLTFVPHESGEYQIRLMKPETESYVAQSFYAYSWGYTTASSFKVNKEGEVLISFDKEKYEVGDKANILFKTPFQGRMLVTVERDKVFEYYYLQTDKKSALLILPVQESYLPNVYITATLFKPLDDGSIPLTVAHGFAPLLTQKASNKIPITINAVEQSRSKTKQTIRVKTLPLSDIEVTIAVVDEGILQLKNFKTPDPYNFFYQKRALEVNSYDLYPNLFPDINIKKSSSGGDGYDLSKRVNPLTNKRVQLVAFWSGILKTNVNGEVSYTIDIPQFSGDLRIMAVAHKDKSFGSSDKHIKVSDPIVISPSLPRFLSPKDELLFPVTLSNTTNKSANAVVKLNIDGAVEVIGNKEQSVKITANSEKQLTFKLAAKATLGEATIQLSVNALNETFTDKSEITVRPVTSLLKTNGAGMISNGSKSIDFKNDYLPNSVAAKLVISKSPIVQFTDNLNYLVGYPYGCVEQTVSKAFPQIYYPELISTLKANTNKSTTATYNVQEAIRKLESMQLYNGGLSYWQGGYEECWWGTVYAAHFLLEAKKAGYEVNKQTQENIFSYLAQKVKKKDKEHYYYYDAQNALHSKDIAPKEIAYSLYLLALARREDISTMNYYKSNLDLLALDSKYLLAASYLLMGDTKSYYFILPKAFEGEASKSTFGGSFYSYIRDEAISLNALLETDPNNIQIGTMVKHLSGQMKIQHYLSTQERAFAFIALGKFLKQTVNSNITASITSADKTIATFKDKDVVLNKNIAGEKVKINISGQGNLYYFWEMEGLNASGKYKEEDNYIKVRKSFYNRFGQPISGNTFRQNDLVVVKISITSLENITVQNVVITDMLPSGLEIENPRIGAVPELSWIKDNATPEYFDIRDDRINFFTTVTAKPQEFYYLVRAVSKGTFQMGPVSADAMYNGEYHSYNGAGVVRITE